MPEPEYDFVTNFVCLTIRFKQPINPHLTDHGELNGELNCLISSLKGSLKEIYLIVLRNPGIKIGLIEYRGSDKTGGYYPL